MLRIVLGIIAGFVVWAVLWIGSDELFAQLSADWYGLERKAYFDALMQRKPFTLASWMLIISLIRGTAFAVFSGYLSAWISAEERRAPLFLGMILLAVGIFAHSYSIGHFPVWYHVLFLGMLIPAAVLGGKLRAR